MRTININETEHGWLMDSELFETAASALCAVRRRDRDAAKAAGVTQVTVVHWWPTTRVGRIVVRALAKASDIGL